MTQDEATRLTAKLFAAYDKPREPLTAAVYVENLIRWDYAIALRAVDELIGSEKWLPSVAAFVEVAQRLTNEAVRLRAQGHELSEPPLSEEERAENLRRMRELMTNIASPISASRSDAISGAPVSVDEYAPAAVDEDAA